MCEQGHIKYCPFCGELPELFPKDPKVEGGAWGEVRCVNPECAAKPSVEDDIKVNDDRPTKAYQMRAIEMWNRRR